MKKEGEDEKRMKRRGEEQEENWRGAVVLIQIHHMRVNSPAGTRSGLMHDLKGVASLTLLLGLMWTVGFFTWGPSKIVLLYLFSVLINLQGQVGDDIPVHDVKPEKPKAASKHKKRMAESAAENTNPEEYDDDDDNESGFYYNPVVQSQVPLVDRTIEYVDTEEDSDQERPVLSTDGPVGEERPITNPNEPELQQENVLQDDDDSHNEDIPPVEERQNEIPESPYPDSSEDDA
ncbi:Adhesion G-protein coupled receptor G4 [Collichthys lucidus]|uniref:Adhesion G-protein coupled receptor G4 n=1 Tax=Collichthys lucidus TaxID=240159 RepID=A0A4U5V5H6_COLLU|nr:Adhesion G-protein coupled receptor G4 [Collichthys lucidus]